MRTFRLPIVILLLAGLCQGIPSRGQTPIIQSDLSIPSKVAPAYFGPNAFPVPEVPLGRLEGRFSAELAGDLFWGKGRAFSEDVTYGPFLRLDFPLWSNRASLGIWMPVVEWWSYGPEVAAMRRLVSHPGGGAGHDTGDAYVSANLHVVTERGARPDVLVRAVLKTASGNTFDQARYYDAPGYFFDATVAKSLRWEDGFVGELRGALSAGFLCWQTDNGRQNDAVQLGVLAMLDTRVARLMAQCAAYIGWEGDGDAPVVARVALDFPCLKSKIIPFVSFEQGIRDYPFTHVRAGLRYLAGPRR